MSAVLCAEGYYTDAVTGTCKECPVDTYGPVSGLSTCFPCPDGSSTGHLTTNKAITACICRQDTFLEASNPFCADCILPSARFLCTGNVTCAETPLTDGGWWRPNATIVPVYRRCPNVEACPAANCGLNECRYGHYGDVCFDCIPNYSRPSMWAPSTCNPCPHLALLITLAIMAVAAVIAAGLAVSFFGDREIQLRIKNQRPRSYFIPKMRLCVVYSVIVLSLGSCICVDTSFYHNIEAGRHNTGALVADVMFFIANNFAFPLTWLPWKCILPDEQEFEELQRPNAESWRVLVFEQNVRCGSPEHMDLLLKYCITGFGIWTIILPCLLASFIAFFNQKIEDNSPHFIRGFGFFTLCYRKYFYYWEFAKMYWTTLVIYVSVTDFDGLTPRILAYACVVGTWGCFTYTLQPYEPLHQHGALLSRFLNGANCNALNTLETISFLLPAILSFLALTRKDASGKYAETPNPAVLYFIGVVAALWWLYLMIEVFSTSAKEFKKLGSYCCCCWKPKRTPDSPITTEDDALGAAVTSHKFGPNHDAILLEAVRCSPFPEEAIAQLFCVLEDEETTRVMDFQDAVQWVAERGHMEPQLATLETIIPYMGHLYSDLKLEISTQQEFVKEFILSLDFLIDTLELRHEVEDCFERAKTIQSKFGVIKKVSRKKQQVDWKQELNVRSAGDLTNRWLLLNRFHKQPEELNRTKANFMFIFPSASQAVYADEYIREEIRNERQQAAADKRATAARVAYTDQIMNLVKGAGQQETNNNIADIGGEHIGEDPLDVRIETLKRGKEKQLRKRKHKP
eukprot:Lankesteria_metandrocarpae@DN2893_c0_g2_i2.p1